MTEITNKKEAFKQLIDSLEYRDIEHTANPKHRIVEIHDVTIVVRDDSYVVVRGEPVEEANQYVVDEDLTPDFAIDVALEFHNDPR